MSKRLSIALLTALAVSAFSASILGASARSELPRKFQRRPYNVMSLTVGYPNDGWQVRAKRLKKSRALKLKPGSEENNYGHPALILMLERSAKALHRVARGAVLVVGDIATATGGPLVGHHSHQSGRDADVMFYVTDAQGRNAVLDHYVKFGANGKATDGSGYVFDDHRNWLLVKSWVEDKRAGLSHIFISRPLRQRLLTYASSQSRFKPYVTEVAALLKQPEEAEPHDDHFHVRVSCPERQREICHEQSK